MNDHKILHLVIDLTGFGGAEMTLLRYLSAHPNAAAQHRIIALRALRAGPSVGARLREKGLVVETLGIEGLADLPRGLIRLIKILRDSDAHILSAWLYYPALIATLLRPFLKAKPRLIWHIRSLPYGTIRKNLCVGLPNIVLPFFHPVHGFPSFRIRRRRKRRMLHLVMTYRIGMSFRTRLIPHSIIRMRKRVSINAPNFRLSSITSSSAPSGVMFRKKD